MAHHPDRTLDNLILPLARSIDGRQWLKDNGAAFRKTIESASDEKRKLLRDFVTESLTSGKSELRDWAKAADRIWHLKA